MAIQFFSFEESSSSAERLFVEDYVKQFPLEVGTTHLVESVRLTKKGTGYLLETEKFLIFLFKNKPLTKQLIGGLDLYERSGNGYKLYCQLMGKSPYFQLGFDSEEPCYWILLEQGKYLSQEEVPTATSAEDTGINLGGLSIPLPPTQVPTRMQPSNNRQTQQRTKKTSSDA